MLPKPVSATAELAAARGFGQACDSNVGRLLGVLAASVPRGGRILEIGTGAGSGCAWIMAGLGGRVDVSVATVDLDADLSRAVAALDWPETINFIVGDALEVVPTLGEFDLVFADATAGKWYGLEITIAATRNGGVLVVDDMEPPFWADAEHEQRTRQVRNTLLSDPRFFAVEMSWGSGVIVATKRQQ